MNGSYLVLKHGLGVLATLALYSVLYRENKLFRLFEHIFLGLSVGWAVVALWTTSLHDDWYSAIVGTSATTGAGASPGTEGVWAYTLLLPLGLMGYFVFHKKHSWLARIPIGIIIGLWSGQQVQIWWNRFGPQIADSMKPVFPTTLSSFFKPGVDGLPATEVARINSYVYPSQALSNILFLITLVSALSYFLFSIDFKSKFLRRTTTLGRWLLMIGFGAIFGSTVMMRFTLLIDRMYFILIEFLQNDIWKNLHR